MVDAACSVAGAEASAIMLAEKTDPITPSAQDEDSDDNISLDLHVSDTEETEAPDKNDEDIPMEIEDDILNKFEIQENTIKTIEKKMDKSKKKRSDAELKKTEENKKESGDDDENNKESGEDNENKKESGEDNENKKESGDDNENKEESSDDNEPDDLDKTLQETSKETDNPDEELKEKPVESASDEKTDESISKPEDETGGVKEDAQCSDSGVKESAEATEDVSKKAEEECSGEEKSKTEEEGKGDEDHDLLTVMEEKTTEADETEFEEAKMEEKSENENENGEVSGNNTDENQSDGEGQQQEKTEGDDNHENQMDIEENDVNGDDSVVKDEDMEVTVIENKVDTEDGETKSDENKENVEENNGLSVLESILTGPKSTETKSTKRVLSDDGSEDESAKKIKLVAEETRDISVNKLNSFKQFMLDKSLKGITREQLEMFCIQKMCESIIQKSEIGELKVKVKQQEQMLDCLRKEVLNVGKQARDLNIVHQKVMLDIGRLQENSDKPLVVPKITRSVGLQAVVRGEDTKRKIQRATVVPTKVLPLRQKVPNTTPLRNSTVNKTNVSPSTPNTPTRPAINSTTPNGTPKTTPKAVNGKAGGVIDLTDEDDTKKPTVVTTQNATQTSPGNVVVSQVNNTSSGSLRGANTVIRTLTPIRTATQLRPVTPNVIRSKTPNGPRAQRPMNNISFRNQPQKLLRHPAPLPNASIVHIEGAKATPPRPHLMLNKTSCGTGIVLSWKMPYKLDLYEKIASYQLYAYQETKSEPKTENWGKIGDVKALELPMAVTLTHFAVGNRYFFAVRAVDNYSRAGEFSHYETILL